MPSNWIQRLSGKAAFPAFFAFFIECFFLANPSVIDDQSNPMKESIGDVYQVTRAKIP